MASPLAEYLLGNRIRPETGVDAYQSSPLRDYISQNEIEPYGEVGGPFKPGLRWTPPEPAPAPLPAPAPTPPIAPVKSAGLQVTPAPAIEPEPEPDPASTPVAAKQGMGRDVVNAIGRGAVSTVSDLITGVPRLVGAATGFEPLQKWGEEAGKSVEDWENKHLPLSNEAMGLDEQGNQLPVTERMKSPTWWLSGIAEQAPGFASLFVPGAAAGRIVKGAKLAAGGLKGVEIADDVLGTAKGLSALAKETKAAVGIDEATAYAAKIVGAERAPEVAAKAMHLNDVVKSADKAANFWSTATAAGIMGEQSMQAEFDRARAKGMNNRDSLEAAAVAGLTGGALGAVPMHFILRNLEPGLKARIANAVLSGGAMSGMGVIQSAVDASLLGENAAEAAKQAFQNGGPAFVLGALVGGLAPGGRRESATAGYDVEQVRNITEAGLLKAGYKPEELKNKTQDELTEMLKEYANRTIEESETPGEPGPVSIVPKPEAGLAVEAPDLPPDTPIDLTTGKAIGASAPAAKEPAPSVPEPDQAVPEPIATPESTKPVVDDSARRAAALNNYLKNPELAREHAASGVELAKEAVRQIEAQKQQPPPQVADQPITKEIPNGEVQGQRPEGQVVEPGAAEAAPTHSLAEHTHAEWERINNSFPIEQSPDKWQQEIESLPDPVLAQLDLENLGGVIVRQEMATRHLKGTREDRGLNPSQFRQRLIDKWNTGGPSPQSAGTVDTIAGRMNLGEFEKKGYEPNEVTQSDWVNIQRANRRELGQPEESGTRAAPFSDYEQYHRQSVEDALKKGEVLDDRVLADYPDLAAKYGKGEVAAEPAATTPKRTSKGNNTETVLATEAPKASAREVRDYLVAKLEEAIENAPDEPKPTGRILQGVIAEDNGSRNYPEYETVTISVPGGGEYKIVNTKSSLQDTLSQIKRLPVAEPTIKGPARGSFRAKKQTEAEAQRAIDGLPNETEPAPYSYPQEQHGLEARAKVNSIADLEWRIESLLRVAYRESRKLTKSEQKTVNTLEGKIKRKREEYNSILSVADSLPGKNVVVESEADLPQNVRDVRSKSMDPNASVHAVYDPATKTTYYVADNLSTSAEAREMSLEARTLAAWLHEQGVHGGIRGMIADPIERKRVLNRVLNSVAPEKLSETIGAAYDGMSSTQRSEEYLAKTAERIANGEKLDGSQRTIWQRFVDAIRKMARKVFGDRVKLSDSEIEKIAHEAVQWAKTNAEPGKTGESLMFSAEKSKDQTDTPEFKKWFGDSEVVDKDGNPLRVYHGTGDRFTKFRLSTGKRTNDESGYVQWSKVGIHFTDSPKYASDHAEGIHEYHKDTHGNIIPAYLSIKNPWEITERDWTGILKDFEDKTSTGKGLRDSLVSDGYDGIIMDVSDNSIKSTHYVVFSPNQIKSAIGNRGAFDETNPDIMFSAEAPKTPEEKKDDIAKANVVTSAWSSFKQSLKGSPTTDGFRRLLAPSTREGGLHAASELSENLAKASRARDQLFKALEPYQKMFDKMSKDDQLAFMQAMDTPDAIQANKQLEAVASVIKAMFAEKVAAIRALGTGKLSKVFEAYFPHIWKEHEGNVWAALARRPFAGGEAFLHKRYHKDVMSGIAAGLTPVSYNPLDLVAIKMSEMDKYLVAHQTINALKGSGEIKFFKIGEKHDGWTLLNDKYSTVYTPKGEDGAGPQLVGHYYATDAAAQVINNYLSSSLYRNKFIGGPFSAYMGVANSLNQFQLGMFSFFHGGFTALESVISQNALGLRQLYAGHPVEAMKSFAKSPVAFISNFRLGDKLIKEWMKPGSQGGDIAQIVAALEASGGRLHPYGQNILDSNHFQRMMQDIHQGGALGKLKAAVRSPFALVEQSARPLMEGWVPRLKFGVFGEMMNDWLKTHQGAGHEEMRLAAREVWNRVDSRLGQVVYDRLFMHNAAKNVMQALVRAPGWTGGTILEVGGGVLDTGKAALDLLSGKMPRLTNRMAYTASLLATTAVINGLLTLAFTGTAPTGADFWAFRTGRKDERGKDERMILPTYTKDLVAYSKHPFVTLGHKANPLISAGIDMARNQDYYGANIRDTSAGIIDQILQEGGYVAKLYSPFWMRGASKNLDEGKGVADVVAPLIGVMPAPKTITQTKADAMLSEMAQADRPIGGYSPQETKRSNTIAELKKSYHRGDIADMNAVRQAARDKGVTLTANNIKDIAEVKRVGPVADRERAKNRIQRRTVQEALQVWSVMTPEEKDLYRPFIRTKIANSQTITPQERRAAFDAIKG